MNVYTCTEVVQPLAMFFERATQEGEIQLQRWDGQRFILKSLPTKCSPLDVPGIDLNLSATDIVQVIREMRERN